MIDKIKNKEQTPAKILWFSIGASILTLLLKSGAYYVTDSVGLLSDALESIVNLLAGIIAFVLLSIAYRPPDKGHPFGHYKAEYFSSFLEGVLIILAAAGIVITAVDRLLHPRSIVDVNLGLGISLFATMINLVTARILLFYGKKHQSITLEADSHHLMTDVWSTVGILLGIILFKFTGMLWIDPIAAIAIAISIVFTGAKLVFRSVEGFMDSALSDSEMNLVKSALDAYAGAGITYHALYTRKSSSKNFITLHLLVSGDLTITQGHELSKQIERDIIAVLPKSDVFIHLEPSNDPDSFDDFLVK